MAYLFVGIGGVIGSLARFLFGKLAMDIWGGGFPVGTLVINLFGAFLLGWMTSRFTKLKKINPNLYIGLTTGIIGSFTTFSTLSVETVKLLESGELIRAFFYILISLFGGLLMVRAGNLMGKNGGRH